MRGQPAGDGAGRSVGASRIRERDGRGRRGLGERSGPGGTSWRRGSGQSPAESGGPAGRPRRPAPAGLWAASSGVCVPAGCPRADPAAGPGAGSPPASTPSANTHCLRLSPCPVHGRRPVSRQLREGSSWVLREPTLHPGRLPRERRRKALEEGLGSHRSPCLTKQTRGQRPGLARLGPQLPPAGCAGLSSVSRLPLWKCPFSPRPGSKWATSGRPGRGKVR